MKLKGTYIGYLLFHWKKDVKGIVKIIQRALIV